MEETKPQVQLKDKSKNQINIIHPYKTHWGYWQFDDEEVGLQAEPFVGSVNDMIDKLTEGSTNHCSVLISKDPIPQYNIRLQKVSSPDGSPEPGWYKWMEINMSGWLCPALLKYFDGYPQDIYVKLQK